MQIKLPSIREIFNQTSAIVFRFQLISMLLSMGLILSLYLTFDKHVIDAIKDRSPQFLLALFLTITLLFPARLAIENRSVKGTLAKWIEPLAMIPGILLFWSFPSEADKMSLLHATRMTMIQIAAGLFVFLFAKRTLRNDDSLWNWHGSLVPALSRGMLYCVILQIGIGAAFGAIDYLFGTKLIQNTYLRINITLFWFVGPFIVLHTIPQGGKGCDPVNLNSFLMQIPRFLLFPLTIVYLIILYVYGAQILFKMDLPKGMVSHLVLGFAGFGLFTFWTLVPFIREEKFLWVEKARRGFFILQMPLVLLLAFGISRRISDYGFTFQRYLIVELAIWLAILSASAIVYKNCNFRVIIGSLAILCLITVLGPINAYTVTKNNQKERLTEILHKGGMIVDGKICKATGTLNDSLTTEVGSIIRYLDDYGLTKRLNSMNPDTGDLSLSKVESITGMSFPYNRYGNTVTPSTYFNFYAHAGNNKCDSLPDGTRVLSLNFTSKEDIAIHDSFLKKYRYSINGTVTITDSADHSLIIPLKKYVKELKSQPETSRNFVWFEQNEFLSAQVLVNSLNGNFVSEDSLTIDYGMVTVLVKPVRYIRGNKESDQQ